MRRPVAHLAHAPPTHDPPVSTPASTGVAHGLSPLSIERVLKPLTSRYVLYYPVLRDATGSAKAALMLSQMLNWTRKYLADRPERGGWFWHTRQDWRLCTGLSRHEQDHARARLRASGCVQERLMGAPARMHFRVDLDALGRLVAKTVHLKYLGWRWGDAATTALLGRPVAFLRGLADLTGSVTAALYLSDLCQQQRNVERDARLGYVALNSAQRELDLGEGWMDLPLGDSANRLGLSMKRLRSARQVLITAGLIEETSSGGVQPRTLSRVKLATLARNLANLPKTNPTQAVSTDKPTVPERTVIAKALQSGKKAQQVFDFAGMAETSTPDVPKPANWNGGNVHSRCAETGQLDVPKPANRVDGFGISNRGGKQQVNPLEELLPHSLNEEGARTLHGGSSGFEIQRSQNQNPLEADKPNLATIATEAIELILPEGLSEHETIAARQLLASVPANVSAQCVADEWAGNLRTPGKVHQPMNYLFGLIQRAKAGSFVPSAAIKEAQSRERRRQNAAAVEAARQTSPVPPAVVTTPATTTPAATAVPVKRVVPDFVRDQMRSLYGTGRQKCTA